MRKKQRGFPPKLSAKDIEKTIDLYYQGLNYTQIGRRFGVQGNAIRERLKQAGVLNNSGNKARGKAKKDKAGQSFWKELEGLNQGKSFKEYLEDERRRNDPIAKAIDRRY